MVLVKSPHTKRGVILSLFADRMDFMLDVFNPLLGERFCALWSALVSLFNLIDYDANGIIINCYSQMRIVCLPAYMPSSAEPKFAQIVYIRNLGWGFQSAGLRTSAHMFHTCAGGKIAMLPYIRGRAVMFLHAACRSLDALQ